MRFPGHALWGWAVDPSPSVSWMSGIREIDLGFVQRNMQASGPCFCQAAARVSPNRGEGGRKQARRRISRAQLTPINAGTY